MSIELKIKAIHLGLESTVIRREENKLKRQVLWAKENTKPELNDLRDTWLSLKEHRKVDVRFETRATQLARAFISGTPYKTVEQKRNPSKEYIFYSKILPRVLSMVKKYHNSNLDIQHIKQWVEA